ncbi:uncharacterized protein LOC142537272 [Primulina tabacum]|uniref:uncharacterized protein LOC142537272 n=1 Tax=Primulina tabacum TaxID=48773 RepID=UPI003F59DDA0
MNVPGLKRMQVASHLQKCRRGWKPSHEHKQDGSVSSKSNNSNGRSRPKRYGSYPRIPKGMQPKFLVRSKERDEQAPPTKAVEDSICSLEPENTRQNIEIPDNVSNHIDNKKSQDIERSDHNVSNNIVNVNVISSNNMINGEMVVEANHESWTIPLDDSLDSGAFDNFDGVLNQMDDKFEGLGLDQIFSQTSAVPDEDPGSFWRSFLSNFESD